MDFKNKRVLVTGGSGMIGMSLVDKLINRGANVYATSLDIGNELPKKANFIKMDLTELHNCLLVCEGIDYVFHLAGIKGSPKMCKEQPASFMVPTIMFNTNMLEAARIKGVKRFLYTSSVGVYAPAPLLTENEVWKTFPSENDKFAGWAKRMGELQIEAYNIQYGIDMFRIVRPTNIYGPFDNFNPANAMVIPSIINRVASGENPLKVWGDGTQQRDFMFADDCADGMVKVFESNETRPVNLGYGPPGNTIREVVELIVKYSKNKPEIMWDTSKTSGDKIRVLDVRLAHSIGFDASTNLSKGIKKTIEWYEVNKTKVSGRYNIFNQGNYNE